MFIKILTKLFYMCKFILKHDKHKYVQISDLLAFYDHYV